MATGLEWALSMWANNRRMERYLLYRQYSFGNQRLAFATEKFKSTFGHVFREFSENLCSPIIDSLSDRLVVTGFKSSEARMTVEEVASNVPTPQPGSPQVNAPGRKKVTIVDPVGEAALELWRANRMDLKSSEVHTETLTMGDAYVIVWPNEEMEAEIWPQLATECCVQYDPNNQKQILRGAKMWWDEIEDRWYLNVYTQTEIVKYEMRSQNRDASLQESAWSRYDYVQNPYGIVPLFHFPNRQVRKLGVSELRDVIAVQDGLNKSVMDMIIAMEFASFKQRYVIGLEIEMDEETGEPRDPNAKNYGVDRLLAFGDPETKVGQFDATDLAQFLRVQEKFWASAARISGTPLHYFFITEGDFPSGEAMKSAEARFVKKISDRQIAFGNVWEDVIKFALSIQQVVPEDLRVETLWKDAAPKSEAEIADTAVKKQAVGVSRSQNLKEMGYDDETISRMLEESDADAERKSMLQKRPDEEATNPNGQPRPARGPGRGVRR